MTSRISLNELKEKPKFLPRNAQAYLKELDWLDEGMERKLLNNSVSEHNKLLKQYLTDGITKLFNYKQKIINSILNSGKK